MIRLRGVSFSYDGREPVLRGADLDIPAGLTLLVGPNGCGKSTLLKVAAGVERPEAGSVQIGGHDLWEDEVAARRGLAYVPEQPDVTPYATLSEILRLVCRLRGEPASGGGAALKRVGLSGHSGRSVRELSMGQRRRVLLAAAMVGAPRTLLLDEPLEAMDRAMREEILLWLEGHRAAGAALVVVTHDIEPFITTASRAVSLRDGLCFCIDPLPSDDAARIALLERLARGEDPTVDSPRNGARAPISSCEEAH